MAVTDNTLADRQAPPQRGDTITSASNKPPAPTMNRTSSRLALGFPATVNDKAARVVASGVIVMGLAFVLSGQVWLLVAMTYGFWARVLSGPTYSPLAQLATRVIAPRLGAAVNVPGPPKRLAQSIGAAFTTAALTLELVGAHGAAIAVIVALLAAASLEAAFGLCLGCKFYALLASHGVISDRACVECSDVSTRAT